MQLGGPPAAGAYGRGTHDRVFAAERNVIRPLRALARADGSGRRTAAMAVAVSTTHRECRGIQRMRPGADVGPPGNGDFCWAA